MEQLNILNIYKINLYISPIVILRIENNTIPYAFYERFTDINHRYPNRFYQNIFAQNKLKFPRTKFAISSCGPRLKRHSSKYAVNLIIFNYTSQLIDAFSKGIIHIVRTQGIIYIVRKQDFPGVELITS